MYILVRSSIFGAPKGARGVVLHLGGARGYNLDVEISCPRIRLVIVKCFQLDVWKIWGIGNMRVYS